MIAFSIAGNEVTLVELLATVTGLTTVFLAGRNSKYNFWVGYIYCTCLCIMFAGKHLYSNMLLQPISLGINIVGHYRWTHPHSDEASAVDATSLKVSMLTWLQRLYVLAAVVAFAGLWGFVLTTLGDGWFPGVAPASIPYLDAFGTALILAAQYLSAQKKWDCWVVWLIVNVTNIVIYLKAGLVFMPIVSGLYLVNGLVSIVSWLKLYEKNE